MDYLFQCMYFLIKVVFRCTLQLLFLTPRTHICSFYQQPLKNPINNGLSPLLQPALLPPGGCLPHLSTLPISYHPAPSYQAFKKKPFSAWVKGLNSTCTNTNTFRVSVEVNLCGPIRVRLSELTHFGLRLRTWRHTFAALRCLGKLWN